MPSPKVCQYVVSNWPRPSNAQYLSTSGFAAVVAWKERRIARLAHPAVDQGQTVIQQFWHVSAASTPRLTVPVGLPSVQTVHGATRTVRAHT